MFAQTAVAPRRVAVAALVAWLAGVSADGQQMNRRDTDTTHMTREVRSGDGDHPTSVSGEDEALAAAVEGIVERTNAFRQEHELDPVERDSELTAAARYFAEYMARTGDYGHFADGREPAQRATKHGYEYCVVSENIAYYYRGGQQVPAEELVEQFVTGWIESEGHRENMLTPEVTQTGVAVGRDTEDNFYFAVQMFGRPKSAAIEFVVVNRTDQVLTYAVQVDGENREISLPAKALMRHTRCKPTTLVFGQDKADDGDSEGDDSEDGDAVGAAGADEAVRRKVSAGDRLVVTRERGKLAIRREEAGSAGTTGTETNHQSNQKEYEDELEN